MCGLAGGGVYPAGDVTIAAVRSYRTISPLPAVPTQKFILPKNFWNGTAGRIFSVALSRGSLRVAVSHHRALPCSDFPPRI